MQESGLVGEVGNNRPSWQEQCKDDHSQSHETKECSLDQHGNQHLVGDCARRLCDAGNEHGGNEDRPLVLDEKLQDPAHQRSTD